MITQSKDGRGQAGQPVFAQHTPGPLSYDGHGVNGPDQYRSRLFTARAARNAEEQAALDAYGRLFAAAPDLLAQRDELLAALKRLLDGTAGPGSLSYEQARAQAGSAIAKAERGGR